MDLINSQYFDDYHESSLKMFMNFNDTKTPLIIFWGFIASGKQFALIRLVRYLEKAGYDVMPVRSFCDSMQYQKECDNFKNYVYTQNFHDFIRGSLLMLVDVCKGACLICQILILPGEWCFPGDTFTKEVFYQNQKIIRLRRNKIWILFTEIDSFSNQITRSSYANQITYLFKDRVIIDKFIILVNKIDKKLSVFDNKGQVIEDTVVRLVEKQFPGLLDMFKETSFFKRFFDKYRCKIVPFYSGTFSKFVDGHDNRQFIFIPSSDYFPNKLWNVITKLL